MEYRLQSLERALDVLGQLEGANKATLTELAQAVKCSSATCLRTLRVLEDYGLVRRLPDGRSYALGLRLVPLGAAASRRLDLMQELRPRLQPLANELIATAHVGLLHDGMVTVLDKVVPPEGAVMYSLVGTRMPLHCSAMGKAILALVGPDGMDEAGARAPLASYTPVTITNMDELRSEVKAIAVRGFSIDRGEFIAGYTCVGVALRAETQTFAVSLSGAAVDERELARRGERLTRLVRDFAMQYGSAVPAP